MKTFSNLNFFDSNSTKVHVDITIILGELSLEGRHYPPKLLLLLFHKMQSSLTNKEAEELLTTIGNVSGKHGFELTRTGGYSGKTSEQSDRNLLSALHDVNTALPRRLGACKITKDELHYTLTYRRVRPIYGKSHVVSHKYCTPQLGESFVMPPGLLENVISSYNFLISRQLQLWS